MWAVSSASEWASLYKEFGLARASEGRTDGRKADGYPQSGKGHNVCLARARRVSHSRLHRVALEGLELVKAVLCLVREPKSTREYTIEFVHLATLDSQDVSSSRVPSLPSQDSGERVERYGSVGSDSIGRQTNPWLTLQRQAQLAMCCQPIAVQQWYYRYATCENHGRATCRQAWDNLGREHAAACHDG